LAFASASVQSPPTFGVQEQRKQIHGESIISVIDQQLVLRCIEETRSHAIHPMFERYAEDLRSTIYCFSAKEICKVLELRSQLSSTFDLPPFLSLQEILALWAPLDVIQIQRFSMSSVSNSTNRLPFQFVSHKHSTCPDKLGVEVKESLKEIGDELIWIDLCSMFQPNVSFCPGYNYSVHTEPVVNNLHLIMNQAEKGYIMLNPSESMGIDPLKVREGLVEFTSLYQSAYDEMSRSEDSVVQFALRTVTENLRCLRFFLSSGWIPEDDYFGRLWCYVERLGMNPESIYVFPGNLKLNIQHHLASLQEMLNAIPAIYTGEDGHSGFRDPFYWKKVSLCYERYSKRIYQLFGRTGGDVLGPHAQLAMLDCWCDADRVKVAQLESRLRSMDINIADWTAALQLCLGKPNLPIGKENFVSSSQWNTQPKLQSFSIVVKWAIQLGYLCGDYVEVGDLKEPLPFEHRVSRANRLRFIIKGKTHIFLGIDQKFITSCFDGGLPVGFQYFSDDFYRIEDIVKPSFDGPVKLSRSGRHDDQEDIV
jgi:hypothetical protein